MSWRPKEDWAHQRSEYFEYNQPIKGKSRQRDYEAGADAMLKELIGGRSSLMKADISFVVGGLLRYPLIRGYWVFIPKEKDNVAI